MTTLTITTEAITSSVTAHYAWRMGEGRWVVSWLPGRALTSAEAETAMLIAELVWGTRTPAKHIDSLGFRIKGVRTKTAVRLASQLVLFGTAAA